MSDETPTPEPTTQDTEAHMPLRFKGPADEAVEDVEAHMPLKHGDPADEPADEA